MHTNIIIILNSFQNGSIFNGLPASATPQVDPECYSLI